MRLNYALTRESDLGKSTRRLIFSIARGFMTLRKESSERGRKKSDCERGGNVTG